MSLQAVGSASIHQGANGRGSSAVAAAASSAIPPTKLYGCNVCPQGKSFPDAKKLQNHLRQTHLLKGHDSPGRSIRQLELALQEENCTPFVCGHCNSTFMLLSSLKRHIELQHLCRLCSKIFNNKIALKKHLQSCETDHLPTGGMQNDVSGDTDLFDDLVGSLPKLDLWGAEDQMPVEIQIDDDLLFSLTDFSGLDAGGDALEDMLLADYQGEIESDEVTPDNVFEGSLGASAAEPTTKITTRLFGCGICNKEETFYSTFVNLDRHFAKIHLDRGSMILKDFGKALCAMNNGPVFLCRHCRKSFKNRYSFGEHVRNLLHGPFICEGCKKTSRTRTAYSTHRSQCEMVEIS
ncbi:MAG: hypothetical protein H7A36_01000 [Chlamydiales bacterium]|nr:hypothetical protein [Chlamydiales bacterium]